MKKIYQFRQPGEGADTNYLLSEFEDLLATDKRIFKFIEETSLDGLWYWDLVHPENEYMSPRFWEVLGYDPSSKQHLASEWQDIINEEDLARAVDNFNHHCEDPDHAYDQLVRYRHADGSTVWIRCRGVAIRDEHGTPVRMLGAHNDVTAIMNLRDRDEELSAVKRVNKRLQQAARYDPLSETLNRQGLILEFPGVVALAAEFGKPISVIVLDLDNFKAVNDTYGHVIGDRLINRTGSILKQMARAKDFVARLGGDEFAVVMPETVAGEALEIAQQIVKKISRIDMQREGLNPTATAGVTSIAPSMGGLAEHGYPLEKWLASADRAMYKAKAEGRNRACFDNGL